jgi:hypothetical protein
VLQRRSTVRIALVSLALVSTVAACAATPPTSRVRADAPVVVSLAAEASAFWRAAKGAPFDEQLALWDRIVERPHADLYDQVVWETARHPDAAAHKRDALAARFAQEAPLADDLPRRFEELERLARQQWARFRARFPDMPTDVPIYAVLSPTFDAKGAVLAAPEPRVVLVFAVDTLALGHENVDVLFPHELFHVHHAVVSGFRNDGVMPDVDLVIPLWEEGLATYVSSLFQPDAEDGALLLQDDLGRVPAGELPSLARAFLRDADAKAIDRVHPEIFARWFMAGAPRVTPGVPNRCAYLLGLHVARRIARTTSLAEMVGWRPAEAHTHALEALRAMSEPQR